MPQFECGAPGCTFLVRADDADEIVDIAIWHAREQHDRAVDGDRVGDRIEP